MKAGIAALAAASLAGSAAAYGYDYAAPVSSAPAAPVKPAKDSYDYGAVSSAKAWGHPAKPSSAGAWPAKPSKAWGDDDEDCDDDEDDSANGGKGNGSWTGSGYGDDDEDDHAHGGKGPWKDDDEDDSYGSKKGKPTPSASWGYNAHGDKGAKPSAKPSAAVKPVWGDKDAYPDYFNGQDLGCCKTVVTVTEYASMGAKPTAYTTAAPVTPAPYPWYEAAPSAGVYSKDETTVTLTNTISVIIKKPVPLTQGDNQWGGYTTTVTAPGTYTCPYATQSTSGSVVWDEIAYKTYECPTAGVYTPVAPQSSKCDDATTVIYAYPTEYAPGTYTRPATTYTATAKGEVWGCDYQKVEPTKAPVAPSKAADKDYDYAPSVPSKAAQPVWSATPSKAAQPVWSAAPSKAASSNSYGGAGFTPSGDKWAMTYTPYTPAGQCKTAAEVDADIAKIKAYGFTTVRLYATDCDGLQNVGGSCKNHGLKIILGVFIDKTGIPSCTKQVSDISAWGSAGNWDVVALIVVGNEAIFNGYCSAGELVAFIESCKGTWSGAGYTGPVTTAETVGIIQQYSSELCPCLDVAGANIQPYFTSSVDAAHAGDFVAGQIALVEAACGKTAYNLECGWPSSGSSNGAAHPSKDDQYTAISDIIAKVGTKTVVFSFEDDTWKDGGAFGVEKYFGCGDVFDGSYASAPAAPSSDSGYGSY